MIRVTPFIFIVLFFTWPLWCQKSLSELSSIPESDGPFEVQIGYNIINITDINEKEETIDFDGAIVLRWQDERLAYDKTDTLKTEIDYTKTPSVVYQGHVRVTEQFHGWRPVFYIPNGIGDRNITNQYLSVWPDGTVVYSEIFQAKVESPMNLRLYPFDKQHFVIFFHPSTYSRDEMIFVPDKSLSSTWNQNMGIAGWERKEDEMHERATRLLIDDGSMKTVSEFMVSLNVKRKSLHVIITFIFPMVLLVSLTWCVFWLDKQSVTDRINILFIGILSVVAYYFVIQDNIPEISYLTFIDVFVLESFLILAAAVVITMIIGKMDEAGKISIGDKLDRISRWAFPASYIILAIMAYLLFAIDT